jgi:hypothetical protein
MDALGLIFESILWIAAMVLGGGVIVGTFYVVIRILDGVRAIEEIRDHLLDEDEEEDDEYVDEEKSEEPVENLDEKKEE